MDHASAGNGVDDRPQLGFRLPDFAECRPHLPEGLGPRVERQIERQRDERERERRGEPRRFSHEDRSSREEGPSYFGVARRPVTQNRIVAFRGVLGSGPGRALIDLSKEDDHDRSVRNRRLGRPARFRHAKSTRRHLHPAVPLHRVDGKGRIRAHHSGEGDYESSARILRRLLMENGAADLDRSVVGVSATGVEAAPSGNVRSPETYVGYRRAERFASPDRVVQDSARNSRPPDRPALNQWGLGGTWNIGGESAMLEAAPGRIRFRFHSRDLHLVLAPPGDGTPVRFKVALDGTAPGDDHGTDCAADGAGTVREPRLYHLIRQQRPVKDRTLEIVFQDPGVRAFAFTFG